MTLPSAVAHAEPVEEITPWFDTCTHSVPVFPRFETVRSEVDAAPFTESVAPGAVFKMPIRELVVSKERNGIAVVEVANENAFTAEGIVEVDPRV